MKRRNDHGVDMSPLIDMVFILLIFFMVTTSFTKDMKLDLKRPKAQTAMPASSKTIKVYIDAKSQIYVNHEPAQAWVVQSRVRELLRDRQDKSVLVVTDQKVPAERLIEVVDQCRAAGAEDVGVSTDLEVGA